ncbi:MAG: 16S rRNA (uracil(1498)-N(3))-methyltransferase [Sphaerochaetaceae bacterium]|nr:16S rRNA (uracil(1498)-N(3))-methyltransferase [Sphaerochaetaceae bacterium]
MNMILFETYPSNGFVPMTDDRAKHVAQILKLKAGDTFKMGIINESEGLATITKIDEEGISFIYEKTATPKLYPVTLICAQVRPICMKRILREAVSLGIERLILCGSDTGEKSYLSSNLYKTGEYKEYLLDGAMQACHAGISEVLFTSDANQAIEMAKKYYETDASYVMLDNVVGAIALSQATIKEKAILAIGPERGWSDRERSLFRNAGFEPMLLGSRVLRTETACSCGLAVLLSRMGLL